MEFWQNMYMRTDSMGESNETYTTETITTYNTYGEVTSIKGIGWDSKKGNYEENAILENERAKDERSCVGKAYVYDEEGVLEGEYVLYQYDIMKMEI